jgi:phosphoserine phosphatase
MRRLCRYFRVMQPTRQTVEAYLAKESPKLSSGIKELFDTLRASGKTVYLVSGGFRQMINPVAAALDVPLVGLCSSCIQL